MKPVTAAADAADALTLGRLIEGYGIPHKHLGTFEELGIIVAAGADLYRCDDDDRLIIAAAAVQLGFDARELRELMKLYDETSPPRRALPHFMKLLAGYQRFMAWRRQEGDAAATGRARRPFRAKNFRLDVVSGKDAT